MYRHHVQTRWTERHANSIYSISRRHSGSTLSNKTTISRDYASGSGYTHNQVQDLLVVFYHTGFRLLLASTEDSRSSQSFKLPGGRDKDPWLLMGSFSVDRVGFVGWLSSSEDLRFFLGFVLDTGSVCYTVLKRFSYCGRPGSWDCFWAFLDSRGIEGS